MRRIHRPLVASVFAGAALLALAIAPLGCDAGGGAALPATDTTNRVPVIAKFNADQAATEAAVFSYDASQGGTAFTDPDGDAITYSVVFKQQRAD
jgi:hypothetical protein